MRDYDDGTHGVVPRYTQLAEIWGVEPVERVGQEEKRLALRIDDLDQRVDHLLSRRPRLRDIAGHGPSTALSRVAQQLFDLLSSAHRHTIAALRRTGQ